MHKATTGEMLTPGSEDLGPSSVRFLKKSLTVFFHVEDAKASRNTPLLSNDICAVRHRDFHYSHVILTVLFLLSSVFLRYLFWF